MTQWHCDMDVTPLHSPKSKEFSAYRVLLLQPSAFLFLKLRFFEVKQDL